jgi:enoyl-CoA hydratase/carnithine racemase
MSGVKGADVRVTVEGHVGIAEICRAPNNYFDMALIAGLAEAFEQFDADPAVRAILLCAEGKNFCAGANFAAPARDTVGTREGGHLYQQAVRLFRCETPIVAAVQGAAVGGGLGLSLVADFRVASADSRFTANFNRLGFHPGFGLSITLPRVVGEQKAALLFYTGRRIGGEEAHAIGLVDVLAPQATLREAAMALAAEIAQSAPIAVVSTRRTLRRGLADAIAGITDHELSEQQQHFDTEDFKEGVKAMAERRLPQFGRR